MTALSLISQCKAVPWREVLKKHDTKTNPGKIFNFQCVTIAYKYWKTTLFSYYLFHEKKPKMICTYQGYV